MLAKRALLFSLILISTIFHPTHAKLPCEYLSMNNGNLVVENGIQLCLGNCPPASTMKSPGIYVGTSQTLFFPTFTLLTSASGTTLTLQRSDGTAVLICDQRSCYSATVPSNAALLPPGFYLTGRPGSPPLSINDPWQVQSNIDLVDGSRLQMVSLQGNIPGQNPVTGWRLVVGNTSYAMTNKNQLVVGNVLASTILSSSSPNSVLAEGPVLVRNAQKACPIPLPRPVTASAVLIFTKSNAANIRNCDLSSDPSAFTYTVPLSTCLASPLTALPNSPLAYPYFLVAPATSTQNAQMQFYSDALCTIQATSALISLNAPCASGWSAIILPPSPNIV